MSLCTNLPKIFFIKDIIDPHAYINIVKYDYDFSIAKKLTVCDNKKMEKYKKLGEGSFGVARLISFNDKSYVYKFINTHYYNDSIENACGELLMNIFLNIHFVFNQLTPNIVTYYGHNLCKNGYSFLIESCDMDLFDMQQNIKDKKEIEKVLIQIILTLGIIQSYYPDFRHNDLRNDNVLVKKLKQETNLYYYFNNKYYKIKTKYIGKIHDHGFSSIKSKPLLNNEFISDNNLSYVNITTKANKSFDIFMLLDTYFQNGGTVFSNSIKKFINNNGKSKKNSQYQKHNKAYEILTPTFLMQFFSKYEINKNEIPKNSHIYGIKNNKIKVNKNLKKVSGHTIIKDLK